MGCPVCKSEEVKYRSRMGDILHSRCAACGIGYSRALKPERSAEEVEQMIAGFLVDEGYESCETEPVVRDLMKAHGDGLRFLLDEDYALVVDVALDALGEYPHDEPAEILAMVFSKTTY